MAAGRAADPSRLQARLARGWAWSVSLVRRRPLPAGVAAASLVLGLGIGFGSFALQSHFTDAYLAGQRLSGWQNFLRLGAPWQSLVPVAVAGLLAGLGALRLRSASPQPPVGIRGADGSAQQLRSTLRAERRWVRIAFTVASGLVGIVLLRFLVYSLLAGTGSHLAASTWPGIAIELGFWLAAWALLWTWNRSHRLRMEGWGIYDG